MLSMLTVPLWLFVKEIGPRYIMELIVKSSRAQACMGRYDLYEYLMRCVQPFVYFCVYSMFLLFRSN